MPLVPLAQLLRCRPRAHGASSVRSSATSARPSSDGPWLYGARGRSGSWMLMELVGRRPAAAGPQHD
eukprot:15443046-Alexandrium_andersonii.AAC.1